MKLVDPNIDMDDASDEMRADDMFDRIANPEKYGLKECPHCHGYGSSLSDPDGVNVCTQCKGSGLVPKETK